MAEKYKATKVWRNLLRQWASGIKAILCMYGSKFFTSTWGNIINFPIASGVKYSKLESCSFHWFWLLVQESHPWESKPSCKRHKKIMSGSESWLYLWGGESGRFEYPVPMRVRDGDDEEELLVRHPGEVLPPAAVRR